MKTIQIYLISLIFIGILFLVSCTNVDETGTMTVKLTNSASKNAQVSPTSSLSKTTSPEISTRDLSLLTAIYLDVQQCEIHYGDTTNQGWVSLATTAGVYNLLDIDTDATVVLVNELTMPAGSVTQMRLILGSNNTIEIGGVTYPLKVPSGSQSGLKIQLQAPISFTNYIEVWLDFDPYHSIVELGNGGYILKPVIKVDVVYQL